MGQVPRSLSSAAVIRRALVVWGLGHLALGDRRGWVLVVLEVLSLAAIAALGSVLLEGTRSAVVLLAVVAFITIWGGQAVHAHRLAEAAGRGTHGAVQVFALVPVAIAAVTAYWLVGGTAGSPSSTLERYVSAWQERRADAAVRLFAVPLPADRLEAGWSRHEAVVRERVAALRASLDATSGLDPARPFASLAYELRSPSTAGDDGAVTVDIEIVRRVSVRTTLFGVFPTASQQTVTAERVGQAVLRPVPESPVAGLGPLARTWRIESVTFAAPTGPDVLR